MKKNLKRTLSIVIEKDPGILLRIISLITRRRFNLETLTIGNCEDKNYRRLILTISNEQQGSDESALQLLKQLKKLINIVEIKDISYVEKLERELLLVKVNIDLKEQQKLLQAAEIFEFTIASITQTTIYLSLIGDPIKIEKFECFLKNFKVIELVRTGSIALMEDSDTRQKELLQQIKPHII